MKKYIFILIIASIATHFLFFGQPRETVFDEVHFGKFISGYFTHEYFFDIHPPLGKLLISGMGYITGFKPGFSFAEIGQGFPDSAYLWLRLLPILAGAMLPIVIYLFALRLGLSSMASLAAGFFIIFENALLTQSRLMLLDPFLLLFGFSALLFYFIYETKSHDVRFLLPAGIFAALAVSVKWTGVTFWAIIMIIEIFKTATNRWMVNPHTITRTGTAGAEPKESSFGVGVKNWLRYLFSRAMFLIIIPGVIYFSIFAIHFALLNKTGPGDAFMTPEFRKTLIGSPENQNPNLEVQPLRAWGRFIELNKQMYKSNATLTAGHPYSSKWYTWPFMMRSIYYWYEAGAVANSPSRFDSSNRGSSIAEQSGQPAESSRIYLLGNPVIWWASTLAVAYLAVVALALVLKALKNKTVLVLWRANNLPVFLLGAWIINLLPFVGISRAMFLYHYFTALVFAILVLVYLIDKLPNPAPLTSGQRCWASKKRIFTILLAVSVISFAFFAPLTYGRPLSERMYNARNWLNTWL